MRRILKLENWERARRVVNRLIGGKYSYICLRVLYLSVLLIWTSGLLDKPRILNQVYFLRLMLLEPAVKPRLMFDTFYKVIIYSFNYNGGSAKTGYSKVLLKCCSYFPSLSSYFLPGSKPVK